MGQMPKMRARLSARSSFQSARRCNAPQIVRKGLALAIAVGRRDEDLDATRKIAHRQFGCRRPTSRDAGIERIETLTFDRCEAECIDRGSGDAQTVRCRAAKPKQNFRAARAETAPLRVTFLPPACLPVAVVMDKPGASIPDNSRRWRMQSSLR